VFFPIVDLLQLSVYQTALSRKPRSVPLVASLSRSRNWMKFDLAMCNLVYRFRS